MKALIDGHDSVPENNKLRPLFTKVYSGNDSGGVDSSDLKKELKEWFLRRKQPFFGFFCIGVSAYFYDGVLLKNNSISSE